MSTLTQPNFTPQWKEEVNRRLAAHKSRKGSSPLKEASAQPAGEGASRAAQAAARVAARYAKAPSYSQMQAEEARVAVRHAEIATQVALQAQAVAESALAEMHAAAQEQPSRGPAVVQSIALPVPRPAPEQTRQVVDPITEARAEEVALLVPVQLPVDPVSPSAPPLVQNPPDRGPYGIRWDPDLPVRSVERKPASPRVQEDFELSVEDWWRLADEDSETLRTEPIELAEADSLHANLIQFPRELVATRRIRPRLAETNSGALTEAEAQLSIFEVDPASISTEVDAPLSGQELPGPSRNRPEWSGMRLDAQPVAEAASASSTAASTEPVPVAPVGLRLMAAVVDCALIVASFACAGFLAARNFHHPPSGKPAEVLGVVALALIGLLYYAFFFALETSTLGMKYAGIGLCTFDDLSPTRFQLRRRLGAMVLSLLPVGLGLVWAVFDEDHLSWHDRFSQTYLRKL